MMFAKAESDWLRAPEPTKKETEYSELLGEATDAACDYAERIIELAGKCRDTDELKKLLKEVQELESCLEDAISDLQGLE